VIELWYQIDSLTSSDMVSNLQVKQHQELQQKISLLELELAQKNAVILKLALQLKEVENALQEIVDTTKNKLKHKPGRCSMLS
jgi:uncharacterized protein involved in exopolysaccharide biosynthesis